jgi:transcriptional regulator with XRE-family HTH domain
VLPQRSEDGDGLFDVVGAALGAHVAAGEQLAAASGVSISAIVRLEKGDMPAEPATIRKLATALGVTPRDLMAAPSSPR